VVGGSRPTGANVVTARKARLRQAWLRAGVWVFIFVFAFSIVGGLIAFVVK